jgi:hypothetical protein
MMSSKRMMTKGLLGVGVRVIKDYEGQGVFGMKVLKFSRVIILGLHGE